MAKIFINNVSDQTVAFVASLVSKLTGVELGRDQAGMVQSRLFKHFSDLGISDNEYLEFFQKNQESETRALVSLLTTHHSYFFREYSHFEYLETVTLPSLVELVRQRGDRTIRIWSAASSRGQEVYSLSMCLHRFLKDKAPDVRYEILGSDVDEKSVKLAQNGVYLRNEMKEIPMAYLGDHWARGQGEIANFVKAKKSIKEPCTFEVYNLLETFRKIRPYLFDIIFCRNVFIYFSTEQVASITNNFMKMLTPQGQLFVGISESLRGHGLPVYPLGPSIYTHERPKNSVAAATTVKTAALVRVLCVDDSPSILLLLKKILTKEFGYEVVGTAGNGLEARSQVQALKPDLVTLDIHMPGQDGIQYLTANMGPEHPPVVMVTSVSRDSMDLAHKAIELGASDFVEKPALNNMRERADEIRTKLRAAMRTKATKTTQVAQVDKEFKKSQGVKYSSNQLRVIIVEKSQAHKLSWIIDQFKGDGPPTLVVTDASSGYVGPVENLTERTLTGPFYPNRMYMATLGQCPFLLRRIQTAQKNLVTTSILVFGPYTSEISGILATWPKSQVLLEDQGGTPSYFTPENAAGHVIDVVPATSFVYMSQEFFRSGNRGERLSGVGGAK